jgi:hypothetical protein
MHDARFWIARTSDSAASVDDFGFSGNGLPRISTVKLPKPPAASM